MHKEKLALIILNYNGLPYVLDCLQSVFQTKTVNNLKVKTIVVDNNSSDESVSFVKKRFRQVKVIRNKENLGFSAGNNAAIKYVLKKEFDYILLLNPDTIVEKDFIKPLIKLIRSNSKIGIVSPVLRGKSGEKTIFALGAKFNSILGRTGHLHLKKRPKNALIQELVSGCCMLIKRGVFEKAGLLDEKFFLYFEDSDFCLRVAKKEYKIYVEPKSLVVHKCSSSLGGLSLKKIKYLSFSNFLFILKWVKPWFWPFAFLYLLIVSSKMLIDWLASKI